MTQRVLCYGLAFSAGACGLAIQVVWARRFTQFFGVSAQSIAVVLAMVLGGLALGAALFGRRADRSPSPLRLAGILMLLCGATAVIGIYLPAVFFSLTDQIAGPAALSGTTQSVVRMLLGLLVVLPPYVMLGGIVPALARVSITKPSQLRPRISLLYGVETLGGALGGLLTGFWLIYAFGLNGTLGLAVGCCLLAGALSAVLGKQEIGKPHAQASKTSQRRLAGVGEDSLLLAAVVLASLAALGMEVVWTRLLLLIVGSDIHSYTIVVTSFLLGIAIGAAAGRFVTPRVANPLFGFGCLQIGVGVTSVLLLIVFRWLAAGAGQSWLASLAGGNVAVIGGRFVLCFLLLLIPTTLLGLSFPLMASHWLRRVQDASQRTGRLYAASAIGNVVGALTTGFLLIPWIGIQRGLIVLAGVSLAAALVALVPQFQGVSKRAARTLWMVRGQAAVVLLGIAGLALGGWFWPANPLGMDESLREHKVSYYREGPVNTVMVLQDAASPPRKFMAVDGVIIGESEGGVDEKQRKLAHLPFALRPHKKEQQVLTIGLGTGILTGELAQNPAVAQITCVELSPAVIEAARQFNDFNRGALDDPKVTVMAADGIHYVRQSQATYDAIISDAKSQPGHVGNAAFFSTDYYRLCDARLAADGLFVQWISLETPPDALKLILRTFVRSFPQSYVGVAAPDSLYLVGAKQPLQLDLEQMQEYLGAPPASMLREYDWSDACDLLSLLLLDGTAVSKWLGSDGSVNSLERPRLEAHALETFRSSRVERKQQNIAALVDAIPTGEIELTVAGENGDALLKDCRQAARLLLEITVPLAMQESSWLEKSADQIDEAARLAPRHTVLSNLAVQIHLQKAALARERKDLDEEINEYRLAVQFRPEDAQLYNRLGILVGDVGAASEAANYFHKALKLDPENVTARVNFAITLRALEKPQQAAHHLRLALEQDPNEAQAHLQLGLLLESLNDFTQSRYHFQRAVELDPSLGRDAGE